MSSVSKLGFIFVTIWIVTAWDFTNVLLVQNGSVPAYLDNLFLQVIRMPNVLFFSAEQI